MNKTAFLISVGLTTFILIAIGGIVYASRAADKAQVAKSSLDNSNANLSAGLLDPVLEQTLNERETAYQQMIDEANTRLEQAQKQQLALQAQLAALQTNTQEVSKQTTLTPEQAATIASDYLGNPSIYSLESVTVRGDSLYKVTFSSGDILYINMNGQVVASEAAPKVVAYKVPHGTGKGGSGGGGGDDEHDEGEND